MVHNGIEYGDMQLICEAYQLMRDYAGHERRTRCSQVFAEWNKGELDSYLIEITRDILAYKDKDGKPLVDEILDTARPEGHRQMDGHRGAGRRRAPDPHRRGGVRPLPVRCQGRARGGFQDSSPAPKLGVRGGSGMAFIEDIRKALYAAKIVSYAQGYALMRSAARTYGWNLNYGGIAHDVARRLHHSQRLPGQDSRSLRKGS